MRELPAGCIVAMVASSSAHHWTRKLVALGVDARIIVAHLVSPYRLQGKGGKNDANDAAAICGAASRPNMRFIPLNTVAQQGMLSVHRLRESLKEERSACVNRISGLLAELGGVVAQNPKALRECLGEVVEGAANELCGLARLVFERARQQWRELDEHIAWCDERVAMHLKDCPEAREAAHLMAVWPVTASATVATVGTLSNSGMVHSSAPGLA